MSETTPFALLTGAGKKIGATVREAIGAVNPDVWREFAYISLSAYSLVLPRRETVIDRGADGHLPVVLVHGLGGNRGCWTMLRLFLRLHGRRRVYAFGYEAGSLEEHADALRDFIERVREATGEARVELVAHSIGGLVARYAIQRLGLAGGVRTLVTLAAPHRGTYAAHYANTRLTLPLRPDSDLIGDLNGEDWSKTGVRLVAVYSDRDVYVVPREMMTHPAAENIFVPNISHSQYLLAPSVFRVVVKQLAS
jgi:pimeloyl-ACP methyl ester carboxylesterase